MKMKKWLLAGFLALGCVMIAQAEIDMLPGFETGERWRYLCKSSAQTTYLYKFAQREEAGTEENGQKRYYTDVWIRNVKPDKTYDISEVRVYSDRKWSTSTVIKFDEQGKASNIYDWEHPEEDLNEIEEDTMPESLYIAAYESAYWREYLSTH